MDKITTFLQSDTGVRLTTLLLTIVIILVIASFIKRLIPKYISATETRYRTRKFIGFIGYFLIVIAILIIYSNKLSGISVFLGVAGAGIAFAIQEIIASIAGFIAINFSNFYKVGDRVKLGGIKGDVIDIGLLRTSLMEIGDWVDGDLYNGRITRVANSFVFKEPVFNYSGQFPFLWDEIKVPVRITSDYEWATTAFEGILTDVQGDFAKKATQSWGKMTESMMVEKAQVAPMVKLAFDENWITFNLRYVVDYKSRRTTKDLISRKILETVKNSAGKIAIASSSLEVTTIK